MVDIDIGAISEALNSKLDIPVSGISQDRVDFVIESQEPTESNGYTWYRKYKSGWVEQGGYVGGATASKTITLPVEMADTHYQIQCTSQYSTTDQTLYSPHVDNRTTTSFICASYGERGGATNTNGNPIFWVAYGQSA